MKRYVLDANALMIFFEGRPGSKKVEELVHTTGETRRLLMSVINWGEVLYSLWRIRGHEVAKEKREQIAQLPVQILEVDRATTERAVKLKAEHNLPYVDCFAAAVAQQQQATLVTGDRDFARVEKWVDVLWLHES